MTDMARAKAIATELHRTEAWRKKGSIATAVAGAMLSSVPVAGGALQTLCDKVGGAIFDPKIEPKFIELCGLVASLEPELEKLKELEAQLSGVAAVIATNKSLEKRLTDIMDDLYPAATKVFGVKTVGAKQEFINVSIRDMNVLVEAHSFGVNVLKKVSTKGGDVTFIASEGSHQCVEDSKFQGRSGSFVGMHGVTLGGHIATDGKHPEQPGISFGPGGSIGFGPGGQIGFGPAKK